MKYYKPEFTQKEFTHPARHFWFKAQSSRGIVYPLIQKNACSAFKSYLNNRIHYKWALASTLDIMTHKKSRRRVWPYWQISVTDKVISECDFIFIYRDPIERLVSTFVNKFIDDSGNKLIFENYSKIMGSSPIDACFNDFVEYTSHSFQKLDPHVWPQKSQLLQLKYRPIKINKLYVEMSQILGKDAAEKYFKHKKNSSRQAAQKLDLRADKLSIRELRIAKLHGRGVARDELITPENLNRIREIYWQDFEMQEQHIECLGQDD